ncbi:phage tail tape measure protein [Paenibacillus alkaliterrae]|uniref:phage tail tape measure protein n=1 Tax=Paenibacillus alkaliterrae TaxID=320909 RepID=UPI001F226CA7|nr:phage tail tape measure protein [Paenibacillus alkaliterrae]MCF2939048.1 phage tail tape measure protein [Paenibacillus alkaliterrae]
MKIFSLFGDFALRGNRQIEDALRNIDARGEQAGSRLGNISKVAGGVVLGIAAIGAAAVAALGVKAVGAADEFNKAMNDLTAETGASAEEMAEFEDIATRIYNNNLGESFGDIASAMSEVKRTTGLAGEELEKATTNALMLRDTFEMDVAGSVNTANSLMKQFGISSDEAFTLIAQGAQQGANKNGDLLDVMNEYAPQFEAMGFSAEQFTDILIQGANDGAFQVDKIGDAIKEFTIRSKDLSEGSLEAFDALGLNGQEMSAQFAAGGASAQTAFQQVMSALSTVEDPLQKNAIGVALFGTQFEDLEATAITSLANVESQTNMAGDTLAKINEVKYDTFGEALQGIGRNLETGILLPLGEKILPILETFADWIIDHMPEIQDFIDKAFTRAGGVLSGFGDTFTWLKDEIIGPILDWAVPFFEETLGEIKAFWEENGADIEESVRTVMGFIETTFDYVMPHIQGVVEVTVGTIIDVISGLTKVVTGVIKILNGIFTGDWKKVWQGAVDIFEGIWRSIEGIVKGVINTVINQVNSMIRGLNKIDIDIPDWVPGMGGKSFGINIATIPMLAKGTDNFKGGLAIVGERGAELVNLPRGSQVIPHGETKDILGTPKYIQTHIYLDKKEIANAVSEAQYQDLRMLSRGDK